MPYVKDDVPGAPAQLNVSSNPWAINQGVATLRSSAALDLDRARALRFVHVKLGLCFKAFNCWAT